MRIDRYDIFSLVGIGLLACGLYLAWPPLAFIVTGTLLIALGLSGAWLKGRDKRAG